MKQLYYGLLDSQRIDRFAARNPDEQTPLKQIRTSITPSTREKERALRAIINARIKISDDVPHQFAFDTEPVTIVSLWTDGISQIRLAKVVERHDIRIGNEGRLVLVLDLHRSPRKHETIVLDGSAILK